jgi:DltD C-terminal region.
MNEKEEIYNLLDSMKEIYDMCYIKIKNEQYNDELNQLINLLIDGFVGISKRTPLYCNEILKINEELSDTLVKVVECINKEEFKQLLDAFNVFGKKSFEKWIEALENYYRIKIIVYGLHENCLVLPEIINTKRAEIVAYIDIENKEVGKYINEKTIIGINDISSCEYDYILLLGSDITLLEREINKGRISLDKIFNFSRHYLIDTEYNLYKKYYELIDNNKKYSGIITGMSYTEVGIDANLLKNKFFNFAVSSQDLFFDYELAKYMLKLNNFKEYIKYSIIGLSYYSFQYDLSKSKNNNPLRPEIYYPIVETVHNYENREGFIKEYKEYKYRCSIIFVPNFSRKIFDFNKTVNQEVVSNIYKGEFKSENLSEKEKEEMIKGIQLEFNKDYPLTVKENKEILYNYLKLLKENNIKPIIVICPVSKLYYNNISEKITEEFYRILQELRMEYDFQVIDGPKEYSFDDEYFYDNCHLNLKGRKKFTDLLNDYIKW